MCIIDPATGMGLCTDRCHDMTCQAPKICDPGSGLCIDCFERPCPRGQVCVVGECQPDPCSGVTCASTEFCRDGRCIPSCAEVMCRSGETCVDGHCQIDPCAGVQCQPGQVCDPRSGSCAGDLCAMACPAGQACVPQTGRCVVDPCVTTTCGPCQQCELRFDGTADCPPIPDCGPGQGDAGAGPDASTDLPVGDFGGGGLKLGCKSCQEGAPGQGPAVTRAGDWLAACLAALALVLFRSRRRSGRR
jgi:hypothetical protein